MIRTAAFPTGSRRKLWPDSATLSTAVQRISSSRIAITMITYEKLFSVLQEKNIEPYRLVRCGIISWGTLERLRSNKNVTLYVLDLISTYIDCSIFSLINYTRIGS